MGTQMVQWYFVEDIFVFCCGCAASCTAVLLLYCSHFLYNTYAERCRNATLRECVSTRPQGVLKLSRPINGDFSSSLKCCMLTGPPPGPTLLAGDGRGAAEALSLEATSSAAYPADPRPAVINFLVRRDKGTSQWGQKTHDDPHRRQRPALFRPAEHSASPTACKEKKMHAFYHFPTRLSTITPEIDNYPAEWTAETTHLGFTPSFVPTRDKRHRWFEPPCTGKR